MELTEENKKHIDSLFYKQLLSRWRYSPSGDPWFEGATGRYWRSRMEEIKDIDHVRISKEIDREHGN